MVLSPPDPPTERPGLDAERLARTLNELFPADGAYWVAYSGGLDSTVLLTALADRRELLRAPLRAVHVDHGLQPESATWADRCEGVCRALDVPFTLCRVDATPARGESPEAAARDARYDAMADVIGDQDVLLTAHHRDDQAETVLLQLMRGAGVAGIAAMPALKAFGRGWHARPLLDLPRAALQRWAEAHRLQWIDDPSNQQVDADRNYLRHRVLPALAERWPGATGSIARTAAHAAAAHHALQEQAAADLDAATIDRHRIDLAVFAGFSALRQRAVLQQWFRRAAVAPPSSTTLAELQHQLLQAREDSGPCFELGRYRLRRFRGIAWLIEAPPVDAPGGAIAWPDGSESLALPYGLVRRVWRRGGIAPESWSNGRPEIRFRAPGFRCQPVGRQGRRALKALAQEHGIPPWQRPWLPLLYIDRRPAAVANCCVCEPFGSDGEGWWIEWSVPP